MILLATIVDDFISNLYVIYSMSWLILVMVVLFILGIWAALNFGIIIVNVNVNVHANVKVILFIMDLLHCKCSYVAILIIHLNFRT